MFDLIRQVFKVMGLYETRQIEQGEELKKKEEGEKVVVERKKDCSSCEEYISGYVDGYKKGKEEVI
ncbi:MAG: hypothetical protein DDT23_01017 [candidate division WS2 bacterium]|nr:hypothetical protein [Candidatus Lithacetigena glycinireducens]